MPETLKADTRSKMGKGVRRHVESSSTHCKNQVVIFVVHSLLNSSDPHYIVVMFTSAPQISPLSFYSALPG